MLNPTAEYKQYVLANKPVDITVDPVTGFYEHNGHSFPTYLRAKWYRDYIRKWRKQNNTITVTNATVTTFTRDGVEYTQLYFGQGGSFGINNPIRNAKYAFAAGGASGGRGNEAATIGSGGGGAGGLIQSGSTTLQPGSYNISIGAGGIFSDIAIRHGNSGSNSVLVGPSGTTTAFGGGFGGGPFALRQPAGNGGSGGGVARTAAEAVPGTGVAGQGFSGGQANEISGYSGGAGGGAGGPGIDAQPAIPGVGGPGVLLDWIATPRTVCRGGNGAKVQVVENFTDETFGNGSHASNGIGGKGGDGFMYMVFPSDEGTVVQGGTPQGTYNGTPFNLTGSATVGQSRIVEGSTYYSIVDTGDTYASIPHPLGMPLANYSRNAVLTVKLLKANSNNILSVRFQNQSALVGMAVDPKTGTVFTPWGSTDYAEREVTDGGRYWKVRLLLNYPPNSEGGLFQLFPAHHFYDGVTFAGGPQYTGYVEIADLKVEVTE